MPSGISLISPTSSGSLRCPFYPRACSRIVIVSGNEDFLPREAIGIPARRYSSLRCGHHWTDSRRCSGKDVSGDCGAFCRLSRISGIAGMYILPIPSGLPNGSDVPCRSGTVTVGRTTSSAGHSSAWQNLKGSRIQSSHLSGLPVRKVYLCHTFGRVSSKSDGLHRISNGSLVPR